MTFSSSSFQRRLIASGVVDAQVWHDFCERVTVSESTPDENQLAQRALEEGLLTKWQLQQIMDGHEKTLVLGNYVVLDKLGQGGMGMVLKAEHRRMKRNVAIKVLSPSLTQTPELVQRFEREVEAAARLTHPNIVHALDADEVNQTHFLVMEYVPGSDLTSLVKQSGPLAIDRALECILQAAQGLEYAHQQGVVHRDIKPSNLLLDHEGHVKILDMGLALLTGEDATELTTTGAVMGTIDYMAPEQAEDTHTAGAPADIYSLGCTLNYLLLGRPVYEGATITNRLVAHRVKPIPSLRQQRHDVSPEVDALFARMIAKKPEDRFASMTEVIAEIERILPNAASTHNTTEVNVSDSITQLDRHSEATHVDGEAPTVTGIPALDQTPDTETESLPADTLTSEVPSLMPQSREAQSPPRRPGRRGWMLAGFGGFVILAGIIITIVDKDGKEIRVEVPDDTKEIRVEQQGKPLATVTPKTISPKPPEMPAKSVDASFFSGKDLTGWVGKPGHWRVENGMIIGGFPEGETPVMTTLFSERSYRDFEISFEARLKDGVGDGGFICRGTCFGPINLRGTESNCSSGKWGTVFSDGLVMEASAASQQGVNPEGFNECTIRCVGDHLTTSINGVIAVDSKLLMPSEGQVGWQLYPSDRTGIAREFTIRNIRFTPLGEQPAPPDYAANRQIAENLRPRAYSIEIRHPDGEKQWISPSQSIPTSDFQVFGLHFGGQGKDDDFKEELLLSICQLGALQVLRIPDGNPQFDAADLKRIAESPARKSLEELTIQAPLNQETLQQLRRFPRLESVTFDATGCEDEVLAAAAQLPFRGCLGFCRLDETSKVGDLTLKAIARAKTKMLNLSRSKFIDPKFAAAVGANPYVTTYFHYGSSIDDATLRPMLANRHLQSIALIKTKVTDDVIDALSELNELYLVNLTGTKVTKAGVARLSERLPYCHIIWDGGTIAPRQPDGTHRPAAEILNQFCHIVPWMSDKQGNGLGYISMRGPLPTSPFEVRDLQFVLAARKSEDRVKILSALATLKGLQAIQDSNGVLALSPEEIRRLAQSPTGETLERLAGVAFTADHLEALQAFPRLKGVGLLSQKSPPSKEELALLKELPNVNFLELNGLGVEGKISDETFQVVTSLPLEELELTNIALNLDQMQAISAMPRLRRLELDRIRLTDDAMNPLANSPSLLVVSILQTPVTNASLRQLAKIDPLWELILQETTVTPAGLEEFQKARPDVRLVNGNLEVNGG
ncbi:protein kinase [bacterium]|nr:protein kinase [bacterium]